MGTNAKSCIRKVGLSQNWVTLNLSCRLIMRMPVFFLLPCGIRDCNTYIEGFGFPYILPSYVLSKICTNYSCSMLSLPCIPHLCRINVKIRYCRFLNNGRLGYLNFLASGFWVLKFSALRLSFLQLQDFQLWASLHWHFQIWATHFAELWSFKLHCLYSLKQKLTLEPRRNQL